MRKSVSLRCTRGGHPSQKTVVQIGNKSMKYIYVVDEQGNVLHKTYERRAKGLVKHGRAYYMDESTICLIRSANYKKENYMEQFTVQDILTRIDAIINQSEYLKDAFMTFEKMPHDMDAEATAIRAKAIMEIVTAREQTNQDLIRLLNMVYENTKES